jgi:hypothetical protein
MDAQQKPAPRQTTPPPASSARTAAPPAPERLLTTRELARALGVSASTVQRWTWSERRWKRGVLRERNATARATRYLLSSILAQEPELRRRVEARAAYERLTRSQ